MNTTQKITSNTFENFDYMLNCVDVNYKVASFKCRYNGNQRDSSGRRVMKQKALPSETLENVLTRSKITANLMMSTKLDLEPA